ncbi:MAG: rhomboid family intramembrane serine protease [Bacteroidetes bacterium]|nr:MAG: rhomboid family intramembrane serine protease [Bacteroidota bacterium]
MFSEPIITIAIIAVTCIVSFLSFSQEQYLGKAMFNPYAIRTQNQYYRFLTHGLIHGDIAHLAFNMLALYSFGSLLEQYAFAHPCVFGSNAAIYFLALYITALVASSLPTYFQYQHTPSYNALGASGAVSAVVFSGITLLPQLPIRIFLIPIDIPGIVFGIVYLGISYYLDKRNRHDGVGHAAHFWGSVYGVAFTIVFVQLNGQLNVFSNFLLQLKAYPQLVPFTCM